MTSPSWSNRRVLATPNLRKAGIALRDGVIARLGCAGSLALSFYPSFVEADNPQSGFEDNVSTPRFSNGYFQLRNRFGNAS